jgi:pimeloyl-ACP methyl ester carboxylesterase
MTGSATVDPILRRLVDGDGPAFVTVDFRGARPEADFVDLFGAAPISGPVYELQPPGLCEEVEVLPSGPAYAGLFADSLAALGDRPLVLLGYCSGGMLALELAAELARRERPVAAVVVFDAGPVTLDEILVAYRGIAAGVGDGDAEEMRQLLDRLRADDGRAIDDLSARLEAGIGRRVESLGLAADDPIGRELFARQRAWLLFVVAAATVSPMPPPLAIHSMRSATMRGAEAWPPSADRVTDFDVPRADLLRSPAVRDAVDAVYKGLFS